MRGGPGTTADQFIAAEFGRETRLPSLEVSLESPERVGNCEVGYSCQYLYTISWRTPTTPLPMENNPRVGLRASVRRGRHGRGAAGRGASATAASSTG